MMKGDNNDNDDDDGKRVFSVPSMVGGKHPGIGHKSSLCLEKWMKTGTIEKRMKTRQ